MLDELDVACIGDLVALSPGEVTRPAGSALCVERRNNGCVLHVHLPRALPPGWTLIGLGELPVALHAPDAAAPHPLVPWVQRRGLATRRWVDALVEASAGGDPAAADLMREMRHMSAEPPALTVRHLSATSHGVLCDLQLHDRHDLVRAVRVERGGAARDIEPEAEARTSTVHEIADYVALSRQSGLEDLCRLRLVYRSGRVQTVAERGLDHLAGGLPNGFTTAPRRLAGRAIALARLDLDLRARAAMLFREPGVRGIEVVYHAAEGALAAGARSALADARAVFGLPHRLVTLPGDADACDRLVAALGQARAGTMLVLGADVLPEGPGWLAPWLCRLGGLRPMLAGTMLDHARAVVHARGEVADLEAGDGPLERRYVGLPAGDLPRTPSLPTVLASAECVGLTRTAADLLLGGTRYPNPDVMLAETANRLRLAGGKVGTLLRCRFVRYGEDVAHPLEEAADACATRLVLKRSFSFAGEESRS